MGIEDEAARWLDARIPPEWGRIAEVVADTDEVLVVLSPPGDGDFEADAAAFRERSRPDRIALASRLERAVGRKVSWGVRRGDVRILFGHLSIPVMTRLRLPERTVLDTLIDAGVARSRSDALAWCVRLVGTHEGDWLRDLRTAFQEVERVRARGPSL